MSPIDTLRDFASEGVHLGIPISKQTIRDAVAEHDTLSYRLAASEARVRELEAALRQAADWFGLSSWEFEQKWGKTLHDSGNQEWAAHLNAALRGAETLHGDGD